jgi:hypothetical protein
MVAPIENVLNRLDGVRRIGKYFKAKCPAHSDRTPSLSIKEGDDGRVLIHCFGGCQIDSVVSAMGMGMTDLFPQTSVPSKIHGIAGVSLRELKEAADFECQILFMVKADQLNGRTVSKIDLERAELALQRILLAKRVL